MVSAFNLSQPSLGQHSCSAKSPPSVQLESAARVAQSKGLKAPGALLGLDVHPYVSPSLFCSPKVKRHNVILVAHQVSGTSLMVQWKSSLSCPGCQHMYLAEVVAFAVEHISAEMSTSLGRAQPALLRPGG